MKSTLWKVAGGCLAVAITAATVCNTIATAGMYRYFTQTEEAETQKNETQENDVIIGKEYKILDTTKISDAYISGDTSALNEDDKETLKLAKQVLSEIITDGMSDYEKELAVYDWMTANIKHDSGSLLAIPNSAQGVDRPYGVLKNKKAVCVGYATTFRLFMNMLGIDAKVVHDTENVHSWNVVKLDDEWYITDIYSDAENAQYFSFNLTQEVYGQRQSWDTEYFPEATGTQYNYAVQNHKDLKDIYKLPKKIKKLLEQHKSVSVFYGIEGDAKSENVQIASYMLEQITTYAYSMYDQDGSLYISPVVVPNGKETIVGVCISRNSSVAGNGLNDETRDKVNSIIDELFLLGDMQY